MKVKQMLKLAQEDNRSVMVAWFVVYRGRVYVGSREVKIHVPY